MNRAMARTGLVTDGGPPSCPRCGLRLKFGTDTQGRTTETCGCGYRSFVPQRSAEMPRANPSPGALDVPRKG
ncbi:MAG TPA: hypothetical protein VH137_04955 [Gemmatimonadales bacterium]|nr:hypothetical protein [Gemmatimonadales bacterium]